MPDHLSMTNLLPLAQKQQQQAGSQLLQARDSGQGSGLFQLFAKEVDDSLTWDLIPWLRTITQLPIFVKVRPLVTHGALSACKASQTCCSGQHTASATQCLKTLLCSAALAGFE